MALPLKRQKTEASVVRLLFYIIYNDSVHTHRLTFYKSMEKVVLSPSFGNNRSISLPIVALLSIMRYLTFPSGMHCILVMLLRGYLTLVDS